MDAHPFIVHFPIALLLASLLFDLLALATSRSSFSEAALCLLLLGVASAVAAGVSGNAAAERAAHPAGLKAAIQRHADFGNLTIWLSLFLLVARLYLVIKKRLSSFLRIAYLVLSLMLGVLLSVTGLLGGKLVFEHGAGVKAVIKSPVGSP